MAGDSSKSKRADQLLVEQNLAASRAQASRLIKADAVQVQQAGQWQLVQKPSQPLFADSVLRVLDNTETQYVSRGGHKLARALDASNTIVDGCTALDVGQSTGGFTDCLLSRGARQVVGVDVGRDQLAERLRLDARVVCLEGINARNLPSEQLLAYAPGGFDLAVMDVSFISQTLILPNLPDLLKPGGVLLSLVKPQFEVGKDNIGKGGLVRDERLYPAVQDKIVRCLQSLDFTVQHYLPSPIEGGDGNREFLVVARRS